MNRIILSGFVSSEPISRYTSNGNHVMHFSLSVRKGAKKNDSGTGYAVNFFDVDAWGKTAEIAKDRLVKGEKVYIEGRLDNDIYEQAGQRRSRTKIIAEYIEYSANTDEDDVQEDAAPQTMPRANHTSDTLEQSTEHLETTAPETPPSTHAAQEKNPINDTFGVTEEEIPF